MTNPIVVGIGDCKISRDPDSVLVTYALGSCIAIMIHDPLVQVGGLLHLMLPDSGTNRDKAQEKPFMFADTGIPLLFQGAYAKGANRSRLAVSIAGGAQMMDEAGVFNIGKRNYLAVRKILWKAGVLVQAEDVGGVNSRTVHFDIASGKVSLRGAGTPSHELVAAKAGADRRN